MILLKGGEPLCDLAQEREILETWKLEEPLLFIYHWNKPVLILGYAQKPDGMDLAEAAKRGVEVFRRTSGGTAVLGASSLSISLILPRGASGPPAITALYSMFVSNIKKALDDLLPGIEISLLKDKVGSPLCFLSQAGETLTLEGRKFFGGAQTRKKEKAMVHGTILLDASYELHEAIFGLKESLLRAKIRGIDVDIERAIKNMVNIFSEALQSPITLSKKARPSQKFLTEQLSSKWKTA